MRKAFIKALCEEAEKNEKIFLLTGDLGFNILEPFRERFPDRFLNVGVAESNLVSVGAGLATTGYIPFIYSIATFASMRAYENIRDDISFQKLNVKIIAVGAGLAYTKAGPTHHAVEDIALMRTLPNMSIVAPMNISQTYQATKELLKHQGAAYMRLERNPESEVAAPKTFSLGKGYEVVSGKKLALLATGVQVEKAYSIREKLKKKNIDAGIYSFPTIQPLDVKLLQKIGEQYPFVVTLEEHRISGGFGTAVIEAMQQLMPNIKPRILRFGLQDIFTPISADYHRMIAFHDFTAEQITKKLVKIL
jgi:transketolase